MKAILILLTLASLLAQTSHETQPTKEEVFKVYSNLVGSTWETMGTWENGQAYHQEIIVETELTKNIFVVRTHDFIDSNQFDNALRNYGIRAWDEKEKKMKFWEFDVFGGITSGEIAIDGNDIYHIYEYPDNRGGFITLADIWVYVDIDTYLFKVCEYKDGTAGREYLSSTYTRKVQ